MRIALLITDLCWDLDLMNEWMYIARSTVDKCRLKPKSLARSQELTSRPDLNMGATTEGLEGGPNLP